MNKYFKIAAGLALIVFFAHNAYSQDEGKRYENPQWKRIVYVDYLPGKYNEARDLIKDYHRKASIKAGTPQPDMILEMNSGEWDIMIVWGMQGGISDLDWDVNPNGAKWRQAMNEIAGSKEDAQKIIDQYVNCISRSASEIARVRN